MNAFQNFIYFSYFAIHTGGKGNKGLVLNNMT